VTIIYQRPENLPPPPPHGHRRTIWDLGPQPPIAPAKPNPKGVDPAVYEDALQQYSADYRAFLDAEACFGPERAAWEKDHGKAAEIDAWSTSAGEAIERDPLRYRSELPEGVELGPCAGTARLIWG
jgi:hypothetical protein